MTAPDQKDVLHRHLRQARETLVWKLDGLGEYDVRRPLTPTGTNLLGLVKHVSVVEMGYFGVVFGRPFPEPPDFYAEDAEANADMWATAAESRADILDLHRRACTHADATIEAVDLHEPGLVPWWPEAGNRPTLFLVLVHVIAELNRHAGHADIVRELVDGAAGLRVDNDNMAPGDELWWQRYRERLERTAREVGGS